MEPASWHAGLAQLQRIIGRSEGQVSRGGNGRFVFPYPPGFDMGCQAHGGVARQLGIALPHLEVGIVGVVDGETLELARQVRINLVVIQEYDVVLVRHRSNICLQLVTVRTVYVEGNTTHMAHDQVDRRPRDMDCLVQVFAAG